MKDKFCIYNTRLDMYASRTCVTRHDSDNEKGESVCCNDPCSWAGRFNLSTTSVNRETGIFDKKFIITSTHTHTHMAFPESFINLIETNEGFYDGFFADLDIRFIPIVEGEPDFTLE